MTEAMAYRGPDEQGYYCDDGIALGQRRLSIIDIANGRQPISNETNSCYLVCNGEIYNSPELRRQLIASGHRFKTSTDVEVILHLYEEFGKSCVKYLHGMFAFAIWHKDNRTLFLARDHMGQKPLFFSHNDRAFVFASEVKAILASRLVTPRIDLDGLWHYVSMRFIPEQLTLFKDIQKLPAATHLTLEDGKVTIERYWDVEFTNKLSNNEDEIADGLHALLLETVNSHLLSDVRVGAFLSGGIDSSTVASMIATLQGERVPTFSIGVKEQGFNELPYARLVAQTYGFEAHERVVQADLIKLIPTMVYHMDEPSDPFGVGVYLVSQIASEAVKVVLGGDGGDENFAGYDRFAGNRLVDYYCLLPEWFRNTVMQKIIERLPETFGYKSLAQKAAWVHQMSLFKGGERYAHSLGFLRFTQATKKQLFTAAIQKQIEDDDSVAKVLQFFDAENADDLVDKMLYTDLMTRMPEQLLAIVDRMTMAHSLECRSPLVDYRVVEYAASIPAHLKVKGMNLKYILKKVAARYLPRRVIDRDKQGFGFPLAIWMRTELKDFLNHLSSQSRFVELGIFNHDYIKGLVQAHISGKADHNFRLWIIMNLEIWHRIHFEGETIDSMRSFIERLL